MYHGNTFSSSSIFQSLFLSKKIFHSILYLEFIAIALFHSEKSFVFNDIAEVFIDSLKFSIDLFLFTAFIIKDISCFEGNISQFFSCIFIFFTFEKSSI